WFQRKGFPEGKLGMLLQTMLEIKMNGLEYLLEPLKKK
ncbi:MAG: putative quorum-sensing-regulated virulence factor, partial [Bacteroidia bacterium]